ncbi:MAG: hypothetical protein IKP00_11705 [Victivallales bacterium]|nr:hypothetical protein [Victivallales bacterium]
MPETTPSHHIKTAALLLGSLYIALQVFPVPLGGRAYLCDLLLPFMAMVMLWQYMKDGKLLLYKEICHSKFHFPSTQGFLLQYLVFSLVLTLLHIVGNGLQAVHELYEWGVFCYMGILFLFFSRLKLEAKYLALCGAVLVGLILLAFVFAMIAPFAHFPTWFCFTSPQMETTAMSLLSRRFAFLQGNPNLFGTFYPLPFAMMTPFVFTHDWTQYPLRKRLLLLPLTGIIMLPLLSSASKHGLLTLAILLSWMIPVFKLPQKPTLAVNLLVILGIAAVFEITVLFVTFPTSSHFPYINTDCGMYRLHQGTYARMISNSRLSGIIIGIGATEAEQEYKNHVDVDSVKKTLEQYNAMASYENFITFMDPHNEYLNQLVLFGPLALILLLLFWLSLAKESPYPAVAMCFVVALLTCCLWDDLLSKRCIWVTGALLTIKTR